MPGLFANMNISSNPVVDPSKPKESDTQKSNPSLPGLFAGLTPTTQIKPTQPAPVDFFAALNVKSAIGESSSLNTSHSSQQSVPVASSFGFISGPMT